ncbi:MAG: histidine phosphatase family protein [Nannocystaceae bacterium]
MPRLLAALIRHGDYEQPAGVPSALLPHPLTPRGVAQAQALGEALAARERAGEFVVDATVDTSSLRRAWETGVHVARALEATLGRPFTVAGFDALVERALGSMANLTVAEIERVFADDPRLAPLPAGWKARSTFKLPVIGAESLLEAGARAATHIDARLRDLADAPRGDLRGRDTLKLFISHGAALRHAAHSLGALALDAIPGLSMYHCREVLLERAPAGDYSHAGGGWKIRKQAEEHRD